jgi:hypothetical protein
MVITLHSTTLVVFALALSIEGRDDVRWPTTPAFSSICTYGSRVLVARSLSVEVYVIQLAVFLLGLPAVALATFIRLRQRALRFCCNRCDQWHLEYSRVRRLWRRGLAVLV